jgi:hypothetical protein
MNLSYYAFSEFQRSLAAGRFSFVLGVLFLFNRLFVRDLFLQGFQWTGILENHPVFNRILGTLLLLALSSLLASLIVAHIFYSANITKCHGVLLCASAKLADDPSLHGNCVIIFMKCMTTICFYACKYRLVKYSLYLLVLILTIAYCLTGNLIAIIGVWLISNLRLYCRFVVLKMFDPRILYLDLTYTTYKSYTFQFFFNMM